MKIKTIYFQMSLLCLVSDVFLHIENFLCPVDYNSLRFTCKKLNELASPNVLQRIIDKLSKHCEDPIDFLNNLDKHNSILSGSFMLACLYDNIEYHDIDIFEYTSPSNQLNPYWTPPHLRDYFISDIRSDTTTDSFRMYLYKTFPSKNPDPVELYSQHCHTLRSYGNIFQHICTCLPPLTYIPRAFDLDICKVAYTGSKLYVKNWTKLIERSDFLRPNGYIMSYYHQNLKLEKIYDTRLEKYEQKGFKIYKHPKHDLIIKYMKLLADKVICQDNLSGSHFNLLSFVKDGTLNLEEFD
jgi:hypothetical protein